MKKRIHLCDIRIAVLLILQFAFLIEPAYISSIRNMHLIWSTGKIIVTIIAIFSIFIHRVKIASWIYWFIVLQLFFIVSSIICNDNLIYAIKRIAYSVVLLLVLEVNKKRNYLLCIKCLCFVMSCYAIINLYTLFAYPNGLYVDKMGFKNCWFLGYDNVTAAIILTGASLGIIISKNSKSTITKLLVIGLTVSCLLYTIKLNIATAIIMIIAYVCVIIANEMIFYHHKKITAVILTLTSIIVFFVLQFIGVSELFGGLFKLLGKSATLTGRTLLWAKALRDIMASKWIGYGVQDGTVLIRHFNIYFAGHLHSYFLQVLYEGGIIGFVIFVIVLFKSALSADRYKENAMYSYVLAGFFMILVAFQVEAYFSIIMIFVIHLHLVNNINLLASN